jgi:hypothetical protein
MADLPTDWPIDVNSLFQEITHERGQLGEDGLKR